MAKAKKLFTIGYEQTPSKAVLDELEHAGVKLAGRRARGDVVAPAGLFQEPACRRSRRARHRLCPSRRRSARPRKAASPRAAAHYDALEKIFAKHLKTPQAKEGMDELSALVKKAGPVCLLCYERDHDHCHRRWIAEIIEERDGVAVKNLAGRQV